MKIHKVGDILYDEGLVYQILDVKYEDGDCWYRVMVLEYNPIDRRHFSYGEEIFNAAACDTDLLYPEYQAVKEFEQDLANLLDNDSNEQGEDIK